MSALTGKADIRDLGNSSAKLPLDDMAFSTMQLDHPIYEI